MLHRFIIIIIGDSKVGKTTILNKLIDKTTRETEKTDGVLQRSLKISDSFIIDFFELGMFFPLKHYHIYTTRADLVLAVYDPKRYDSVTFLKRILNSIPKIKKIIFIQNNSNLIKEKKFFANENTVKISAKDDDLDFLLNLFFLENKYKPHRDCCCTGFFKNLFPNLFF
jgi:GTPase SAR1 family protein